MILEIARRFIETDSRILKDENHDYYGYSLGEVKRSLKKAVDYFKSL